MIERRNIGELTTYETRSESNGSVNKALRYKQIESILINNELTAKEIAVEMYKKGYVPTPERNFSSPRLNELMNMGIVEVIGKKVCEYTGKKVSVYKYNGKQSTIFDFI
jgi:hypothetical protein